MNTVTSAWQAAIDAIKEAHHVRLAGGDIETVRDLLQHARDLIAIIEEEIVEGRAAAVDAEGVLMAAAELRKRLEVAAATLTPLH